MDDLNGDGVINVTDAKMLSSLAKLISAKKLPDWTPGGLSTYKQYTHHGPFIHVDARGHPARW